MSTPPERERQQLEKLTKSKLIALVLTMQEQMAALQARVQALHDQIAKDSHNSSKPPSIRPKSSGTRHHRSVPK